jgi:Ser/Thr protein kinase RdoA (MazF antagonist)
MTDTVFPVIYSTLSSAGLVEHVLPHYSLGTVTRCQFWCRGMSDVYQVETAEQSYILRVTHAHWRTKADIDFELDLLAFLHQRQLPVAYPLRTTTGQLSVELDAPEGKRYAALFIYAPGAIAIGDLNLKQGRILGETLAKVHHVGLDFHSEHQRQALTLQHLLDDSFQVMTPFLQHRAHDLDYIDGAIAQIKLQLHDFPRERPFWVPCWGDPHSGNAHFTDSNQITLFDFDQCGYGWRIFDISKFWHIALSTGISKHIRQAFLDGYQSVEAITPYELDALQAFTQAAHLWMWSINLTWTNVHNTSRLDDFYFTQRLEQLKFLRSSEWQLF